MTVPTFIQIFKSLGVALLVAGILFGAALGWDSPDGLQALWIATAVAFFATAVGLLAAGALRDIGNRPTNAPSAYRVGLVASWFLMLLGSALVVLPGIVAALPYFIWLALHAIAQAALQAIAFRREDADEVARRTKLNAGMTP